MDFSNIESITDPIQKELTLFEQAFAEQLQVKQAFLIPLIQHTLGNSGKRLRPILFFLSHGLIQQPSKKAISVAVLLEVLHTATLVHDDVIDSSRLRRGQATVNAQWNDRISILWGDFLFAHVFSIASKVQVKGLADVVSDVVRQIGIGELRQAMINPKERMTPDNYLQIIQEKTASLISASCQLGAYTAKADVGQCEALKWFGQNLGIAFQIRDDVLDFEGDPNVMGKPSGQDLSEGILTLPLLLAMQEAPQKEQDDMIHLIFSSSDDSIKELDRFVKTYSGIDKAQNQAIYYSNKAKEQLISFQASPYRDGLENLIQYNLDRVQ